MFCHKCGHKSPEDSAFCQKCGEKLITDEAPVAPVTTDTRPTASAIPQKKSKKLIFGIAGIAVAVIAAIVVVLNLSGGGQYPDELLFEGLPASRFLDMTRDDIIAEFGEPDTYSSGEDYYDDSGIYGIRYSEDSGKVAFIKLSAAFCSFNGTKLRLKTYEQAMKLISSQERMFTGLVTPAADSMEIELYGSSIKYFRSAFRPNPGYTLDFVTTALSQNEDTLMDIALYVNGWSIDGSNPLTDEEALEIAQRFLDSHPLYVRTITGVVEKEPADLEFDTSGLYKIELIADDGSYRSMFVSINTGEVFISPDGLELLTGEEFYNKMFLNPTGDSASQGTAGGASNSGTSEWITHTDVGFSFKTPDSFESIGEEYPLELSNGDIAITYFSPAPLYIERIVNESTAIDPFTFDDGQQGHIVVHETGVHFFSETVMNDGIVSEAAAVLVFASSGDGNVLDNRDLILEIARSLTRESQ